MKMSVLFQSIIFSILVVGTFTLSSSLHLYRDISTTNLNSFLKAKAIGIFCFLLFLTFLTSLICWLLFWLMDCYKYLSGIWCRWCLLTFEEYGIKSWSIINRRHLLLHSNYQVDRRLRNHRRTPILHITPTGQIQPWRI